MSGEGSDLLRRLDQLAATWRAQGQSYAAVHATLGSGWMACADDLSALLRSTPPESTCESECNPFHASCGALFCTYEDMAHHEKTKHQGGVLRSTPPPTTEEHEEQP